MRTVLVFLLCFSGQLFAKSEEPSVYLTWKNDPTTTMTVMWITKQSDDNDTVHFQIRDAKSPTWEKQKGSHQKLPNKKPYLIHKAEIKGLKADTIYTFHVGNKNKTWTFHTMPRDLNQPVRFVTGGDAYHNSFKKFKTMCQRAARENPRFAIIGGDIAYAAEKRGGEENWSKWQEFFACWSEVMRDKDGCLIPILTTIGNHEVTGSFSSTAKQAPFYYMFFEKATYDMSFGSYLHLTFLDSNHTKKIKGDQTKWLEKTLKNNKNHTHRFAIYHVGAYPSSNRLDSPTNKLLRKHWVPLFEKYKIHACFESHDHAYKRTFPMLKGKKAKEGVVYFGDGCWGVTPRKPQPHPYLAHKAQKQQALVVEVSKNKRKFWAVDPKGKMIDYYEQSL
ncbi:MAG: metallophosphoesterase family protein [Chlamydiales bacterium]|nr:metallophosphoesterase family protein [Chlamydiales bacterium]